MIFWAESSWLSSAGLMESETPSKPAKSAGHLWLQDRWHGCGEQRLLNGRGWGTQKPTDVGNHSKSILPVSQTHVLLLHLWPASVFSVVVFARFPLQLENATFGLYIQSPAMVAQAAGLSLEVVSRSCWRSWSWTLRISCPQQRRLGRGCGDAPGACAKTKAAKAGENDL